MKLGVVPFLNVKPLIFPLEQNMIDHDFALLYARPSELSLMMDLGFIDLGLLPVAELIENNPYRVVPGVSISSFGKVDSVVLLSRVPLKRIERVALDSGSQSSSSLLRVILELFLGLEPRYVSRHPHQGFLSGVDAGMYIGNPGLRANYSPPPGWKVHDLGEIWTAETGLPFVYALYAVKDGIKLGEGVEKTLVGAKELGRRLAEKIALVESEGLALSPEVCLRYLTERIGYELGEREMDAIAAYAGYLGELGYHRARSFRLELYSEEDGGEPGARR